MNKNCISILILFFIISINTDCQWYKSGEQELIRINSYKEKELLVGGANGLYLINNYDPESAWREYYYPTSLDVTDIHKINDTTLVLCIKDQYSNDPSQIVISRDNGNSWEVIINKDTQIADFYVANDSSLIFAYPPGICRYNFKTSTEDTLWAAENEGFSSSNISSVFFINDTIGFAAGGVGLRDEEGHLSFRKLILKTTNGGLDWSICFQKYGSSYLMLRPCFNNLLVGYIREESTVYISYDLGNTWLSRQIQALIHQDGILGAYFTSPDTGYVASTFCVDYFVETISYNKIFKTIDGGETWNIQYMDTLFIDEFFIWEESRSLRDIIFLNSDTGYAIGNKILLSTVNAGGNDFISDLPLQKKSNDLKVYLDHEGQIKVLFQNKLIENYSLKMFDLNGRLIHPGVDRSDNLINSSRLRKGIYILEINIQGSQYVLKLPII